MRSNFVLIDCENIQPEGLHLLAAEHFRVMLFLGANQTKVPTETVLAMRKLGDRGDYVKISGTGPNALDFHIAYYIGELSALDPSAYFHIVSKDTGFDPLIQHLNGKKVNAARVNAIHDIRLLKAASPKLPEERIQIVVENLSRPKATKPGTVKALRNSIASFFQKQQLSEEEVDAVVDGLATRGFISVSGTKVTYVATIAA